MSKTKATRPVRRSKDESGRPGIRWGEKKMRQFINNLYLSLSLSLSHTLFNQPIVR